MVCVCLSLSYCILFPVRRLDLRSFAQFGVVDIRGNGRAFVAMKETGGMTLNVSCIITVFLSGIWMSLVSYFMRTV